MNVCGCHPRLVYYDGKHCPCCQMLREIPWYTRKVVFLVGGVDKYKKWR